MIKLLIFDIDGVIIESKKLHEIAFILALKNYGINITESQHKNTLDGLPTKVKLDKLNVPDNIREKIFDLKQKITFERAKDFLNFDENIFDIFKSLHENYKIAIASNAIKSFCKLTVDIMKIEKYVDFMLSNEDVPESKPSPMIYNKIMEHFSVQSNEVIIFEDSKFGLKSAFSSGGYVFHTQNPSYLNLSKINKFIEVYNVD